MAVFLSKWEKEWNRMQREEYEFLQKGRFRKESRINRMLERHIPDGLQDKLDVAFAKAFELIFQKGTGIIEKTYDREGIEEAFDKASLEAREYLSSNGLHRVSRNAGRSKARNLLLSGIEGIGLGAAGIGLPDIPIFAAVLLKGVYEVALHYGYDYDSETEKYFILRIIEVALLYGADLDRENAEMNKWIDAEAQSAAGGASVYSMKPGRAGLPENYDQAEQIRKSSSSLSTELLYMKFLQGLPIVGAIGGAYDAIYVQKVLAYAELKYHRRFLLSHDEDDDGPIIA